MFIDFIFFILLLLAIFKGYSRGLIVAVFSLAAFFIGLVAAIKLSASVAVWLQDKSGTQTTWMPFIAFILVMAVVMLLIRLGARMIEKAVEFVMFGWLNKLGGMFFYALLYITFFSIVLFYAENLGLLAEDTINSSKTYSFVAPWAPKAIDAIGSVIPVFKGLFGQLETFFDSAGRNAPQIDG
jgi:membrane protein required for colicin V production